MPRFALCAALVSIIGIDIGRLIFFHGSSQGLLDVQPPFSDRWMHSTVAKDQFFACRCFQESSPMRL